MATAAQGAEQLPRDGAGFHREAEQHAAEPGVAPSVQFRIPIELGQGFKWKPGEPLREYTWSGGAVPTLRLGRLDFGFNVSAVYRNPSWDAALGPRISKVVAVPFEMLALKVGVEGDYLPAARSFRASLVGTAGLGELIFVRAVVGWDVDQEAGYFLFGVGFEPMGFADPVGAMLWYGKIEDLKQ